MATAKRLTYTWGLGLPGGIGGLLDLYRGAVHFSYLYDGKGNVTGLLDPNGNVAATYQYDPFGVPRVPANSIKQPFQFSTKPYDEKTGLSYYGYRYYVPALGRWLTRDPLGEEGGINLYNFSYNNPINWTDFLGLVTVCKGQWKQAGWDSDYQHWFCWCYWRCVPWDNPPRLCDPDYRKLPDKTPGQNMGSWCRCAKPGPEIEEPPPELPLPNPWPIPPNFKPRPPGLWSE